MTELNSALLFGAGLVMAGTVATWPALRRIQRRQPPTAHQPASQPPERPTAATPFALLKTP
jgi:hypothetical protein